MTSNWLDVPTMYLDANKSAALRLFACALILSTSASTLDAQAIQTRQFTWENDRWAFRGEDRSYTNGVRLEWRTVKSGNAVAPWAERLSQAVYGCSKSEPVFQCATGVAIGQHFYTPDSLHIDWLQEADRPYGGYLYGSLIVTAATEAVMLLTELNVGVVGDLSMAESTQKGVHKLVGATHPKGWDNQLGFEIAGALRQSVRARVMDFHTERFNTGRWLDIVPFAEGVLGTTFTHLELGGQLRIGYNLTLPYSP